MGIGLHNLYNILFCLFPAPAARWLLVIFSPGERDIHRPAEGIHTASPKDEETFVIGIDSSME